MSDKLGFPDRKGAESELEDLKLLGGVLGLAIGGVGGVKGLKAVPRERRRTRLLERESDEVGGGDVAVQVPQAAMEVGFANLTNAPLIGGTVEASVEVER